MPYITVRSKVSTAGFPTIITYIDYYPDEDQGERDMIEAAMTGLGASPEGVQKPWCVYRVYKPPHFVLNGLERLAGYKVVASNSISESHSFSHQQIWTLHKKPQSSANQATQANVKLL